MVLCSAVGIVAGKYLIQDRRKMSFICDNQAVLVQVVQFVRLADGQTAGND